jgi:glycine cleavage system H protein
MGSPQNLRYTDDHEWARLEADGTITVGITDHAQDALGDVVFVDLPAVGRSVDAKGTFGVVESVKTVSDLYAPCAGEIVAVNEELSGGPEQVNKDPYGAGWIVRLRPAGVDALAGLKTADEYDAYLATL